MLETIKNKVKNFKWENTNTAMVSGFIWMVLGIMGHFAFSAETATTIFIGGVILYEVGRTQLERKKDFERLLNELEELNECNRNIDRVVG